MIDKLIDIHLSGDAFIKRTEKENYVILLYSGSVNKELRGKGLFKEFLNYIISELRKLGIKNICLQTEQGYYPEKLYTKIGFKKVALGRCYNIRK